MKRRPIYFIILLCTALFFIQCTDDNEEELNPENCFIDDNLTYTDNIADIINSNCATAGCHNGGNSLIDLSSYTGVSNIAENGTLERVVIIEQSMPPAGPLSECEQEEIQRWINDGAEE
jgi:hypothetical protein